MSTILETTGGKWIGISTFLCEECGGLRSERHLVIVAGPQREPQGRILRRRFVCTTCAKKLFKERRSFPCDEQALKIYEEAVRKCDD